jgi:hypothetical protein
MILLLSNDEIPYLPGARMSVTMLSRPDSILTSTPAERRSLPRLLASGEPARIAWKVQGFRVRKASARLIDISANGVGLLAAQPAKPGQVFWLGVESLPCEWVKATVRCAFSAGLFWRFNMVFCEPCAVGLLEEAIGHSAPNRQPPPDRFLWDDEIEDNYCVPI